ncbi:uncharacterized protein BROUX77_002691 [Berkeleyomyces rouxiae]|uniref:uncharacterized protein n=1 Tax=Berkeleyomyces rouxiae TaxID=2035830 RepID=UPI003B780EEE
MFHSASEDNLSSIAGPATLADDRMEDTTPQPRLQEATPNQPVAGLETFTPAQLALIQQLLNLQLAAPLPLPLLFYPPSLSIPALAISLGQSGTDQFKSQNAIQNAGQKLSSMRMGANQSFASFLVDFEYQLGICEGLAWPHRSRIIHLNNALNSTLKFHLAAKNLPDDNYDNRVKKVKRVTGRVEGLSGHKSKDANKAVTWHEKFTSNEGKQAESSSFDHAQSHVDADGDTRMAGVNATLAKLTAAVNALQTQGQSKPLQSKKPPV